MSHSHGSPSLACTYSDRWARPCPFAGERYFPSWACYSCGMSLKAGHLPGCRRANVFVHSAA